MVCPGLEHLRRNDKVILCASPGDLLRIPPTPLYIPFYSKSVLVIAGGCYAGYMGGLNASGGCARGVLFGVVLVLSLACVCAVVSAQYAEEDEFVAWYTASMSQVEYDALQIATAIENYDCTGCEAWAGSSYDDITMMLSELETYEVSAALQPVKTHVKQGLEDFREACYHAELGAMMYDAAELQSAASYVSRAHTQFKQIDALGLVPPTPAAALKTLQENLEQAAEMVGGAHTPSPTPTSRTPGWGAPVVVGGLLLIAYLLRRRAD